MRTGTAMDSRTLPVKLTEHEVAERGESIAKKLLRVKALRKQRRDVFKNLTAQIDAELDNIEQMSEALVSGVEARAQSDLKFTDEVAKVEEPTTDEAAAVLAEVGAIVEPKYHHDGIACKRDTCRRRRHLTLAQCRANGIAVEGDELMPAAAGEEAQPDGPPKCVGCNAELTATEIVKKLGLCETCQLQPHEEVNVQSEHPSEAETDAEMEAVAESIADEASADLSLDDVQPTESETDVEDDDPRPRCSECRSVLTPDEVTAELGMCSRCVDKATSEEPSEEVQA